MYDVCTRAHMSFMSRTLFGSIESQQLSSKVIKVLTVRNKIMTTQYMCVLIKY